tara:strand:+ start:454 stop:654 length:201 start_codon:yes stop_codon:yes gene_type:complete
MNIEIKKLHVNRGIFIHVTPGARITKMVAKKFTPANVEDAPSIIIPAMNDTVPALFAYMESPVRLE